ncbi:MAG: hypothetical protein BWY09_02690 [Candidatus Hydrogenedentes bacterium ADurb.Bin179]|nr:MAG: hypothetical protein BWY09_02690 [Candidatus Hydrogenedentes bacterium ADurb.Bin179]
MTMNFRSQAVAQVGTQARARIRCRADMPRIGCMMAQGDQDSPRG